MVRQRFQAPDTGRISLDPLFPFPCVEIHFQCVGPGTAGTDRELVAGLRRRAGHSIRLTATPESASHKPQHAHTRDWAGPGSRKLGG